jgi:hypothetical protein
MKATHKTLDGDKMNGPHPLENSGAPATAPTAQDPTRTDLRLLRSFAEFYPHYLREHGTRACRRLHFVGTTLSIVTVLAAVLMQRAELLLLSPVCGYAFAWIGHFAFEHNKPATFVRPLYSLMGDYVMYRDMWLGKVRL